jgi:putative endonuclease
MTRKARERGAGGTSPALCHAGAGAAADNFRAAGGSRRVGAAFEQRARRFLERERLAFVAGNVTVRGGEIDLVMRERDGTLVFVEVRARASGRYGGAAASIGARKRRRILFAAQAIWARAGGDSACRFDVIAFEAGRLVWLRDAFRADEPG